MRHRKRGRRLGRSSSHRKAMYRNMASSLFLTFRDEDFAEAYGYERKQPAGRIITTLEKAKEVRSLVEKCITIARKAVPHREASEAIIPRSELSGDNRFRKKNDPERWAQWSEARAPYVTAQRRCFQLLGSREAVALLFDVVVDEIGGRTHGYTRIVRLATPRLGDAGTRAILEIVQNDKVRESYSSTEALALEVEDEEISDESAEVADDTADDESGDEVTSEDAADESADDADNEEAAADEDADSEAEESEDDDSEAEAAEESEESADDEPAAEADSEEEASSDDSEEASSEDDAEDDAEASDEDESSDEESDD